MGKIKTAITEAAKDCDPSKPLKDALDNSGGFMQDKLGQKPPADSNELIQTWTRKIAMLHSCMIAMQFSRVGVPILEDFERPNYGAYVEMPIDGKGMPWGLSLHVSVEDSGWAQLTFGRQSESYQRVSKSFNSLGMLDKNRAIVSMILMDAAREALKVKTTIE